jgi:hypothetical protein
MSMRALATLNAVSSDKPASWPSIVMILVEAVRFVP